MIINVSFDGRKLFTWEGGIAEATKIEKDVSEVAALGNISPETLWQSTLAKIAANGGRFFPVTPNHDDRDRGAVGAPNPSPGSSWSLPRLPRFEFRFRRQE